MEIEPWVVMWYSSIKGWSQCAEFKKKKKKLYKGSEEPCEFLTLSKTVDDGSDFWLTVFHSHVIFPIVSNLYRGAIEKRSSSQEIESSHPASAVFRRLESETGCDVKAYFLSPANPSGMSQSHMSLSSCMWKREDGILLQVFHHPWAAYARFGPPHLVTPCLIEGGWVGVCGWPKGGWCGVWSGLLALFALKFHLKKKKPPIFWL